MLLAEFSSRLAQLSLASGLLARRLTPQRRQQLRHQLPQLARRQRHIGIEAIVGRACGRRGALERHIQQLDALERQRLGERE